MQAEPASTPQEQPQMGPPVEPEMPAEEAPEAVESAQPQEPVQIEIPPEHAENIMRFANELEEAIKGQIVGPKMFAREFLKEAGAETTRMFVTALTAEQFIEQVEAAGGQSSPIVTRDGREFCREAWAEALRLTDPEAT
jgi:hypothetical protein